ncbi:MAG: ATP-binding protein [Candidatus Zixiibacteriota bacterium]
MKRRKLLWKVYPYYFAVIVASLILTAFYAAREMRHLYLREVTTTLEVRAHLISKQIKPLLQSEDLAALQKSCGQLGVLSGTRITVIGTDGVVLGDSDKDPRSMENHGSRPEIRQALAGNVGVRTRFSNTLQRTMMYVSIPVKSEGQILGVLRTSLPVSEVEQTFGPLYQSIATGGLIVLAFAIVISLFMFRRITNPLRQLQVGTGRFAQGDLRSKLPVPDTEEIAELAESMNRMAEQLDERIQTVVRQRNERDAILSSMSEGVLALDAGERIVSLNRAAADYLGLSVSESVGRSIHEAARITALHDFVARTVSSNEMVEAEIILSADNERCLQAHGTALTDDSGNRLGVVMVFNDITRLKRLEAIRRDFVANVSHELKTPVTAIMGSVETLLSSSHYVSDDDGQRFLLMISKHSDRLKTLIEDLLSLARLENEFDGGTISRCRGNVSSVLESSIEACQEIAVRNQVKVECTCDPELEEEFNYTQLVQAVTNLIDNAIRYSDMKATVSVTGELSGNELVVSVCDNGCGIDARHLPRLFERFYRVDVGRSREAGGTGLGLAIVKHVAIGHGGRVTVNSTPGKGSTFRIHLPSLV